MGQFLNIRVADFDTPLGFLEFSETRHVPIRRADYGVAELWAECLRDPLNFALQLECLQRVLPTATPDELRRLNGESGKAVLERSLAGVPEVEALLGESLGARTQNGSTDSPPGTETPSSSTDTPPPTG